MWLLNPFSSVKHIPKEFFSQKEMPMGAGSRALPDRKWSHWHANTITVLLSLGAHHGNFVQGTRGGWTDWGKDERWIESKGGSEKGDNKARLLGGRTFWVCL